MGTAPSVISSPAFDRRRVRNWIVGLLLAILLHAVMLSSPISWLSTEVKPARVEVNPIDPQKLEQIRNQWKRRERDLVISNDRTSPRERPKDSRFESDRDRSVEKETRARNARATPKQGAAPGAPGAPAAQEAREKLQTRQLERLALPMKLDGRARPRNEREQLVRAEPRERGSRGDGAEEQVLLDKNLAEGTQNLLNTQESIYYSFYARLYEQVDTIWRSQIGDISRTKRVIGGDYTTVVDLVLSEDGNLIDVVQNQSSGVPEFDRAVQTAWRKIGRFPNPPKDLVKNGEVHTGWTFTVRVGDGAGFQYVPPERTY